MTAPEILLIDDDRVWLQTLAEFLRDRGFRVWTAEGPRPGQKLLEEHDVLVAVIDFDLPEMNGLELLRRMRRRHRNLFVLMLSGADDPGLAEEALAEGANAFLSKTMPPRRLLQALVQFLVAGSVLATLTRILSGRGRGLLPAPEEVPPSLLTLLQKPSRN